MAKKFYKCAKCGNIISKYVDSGVPIFIREKYKILERIANAFFLAFV